ncbi:MarC family protein [uncultured Paraglaciecola sp.]|uniref:MarC family protein n=1 Tax=uncultured Paraglaciecola sp. TaxID=1765024 RepID=UPI0030D7B5B3|tara:strand:- start:17331 stop:17939 length:609 start_codon:yes stop_codon:yes gene_type:complete
MIDFLATFIFFFAVIDPIGTVPVFIAVTQKFDNAARRKIALYATLTSAAMLIFFVVAGELILTAMGIPLSAFQIAGGIVLFLFALSMIFGESKPDAEVKLAQTHNDTAVFPLAVPSIASPGAMLGAVILTENSRFNIMEQMQTVGMMLLVLFIVYILMLGSNFIIRIIGNSGASVVSRVMGLILAAVATTNTLGGIKLYFEL